MISGGDGEKEKKEKCKDEGRSLAVATLCW
jgi:hypothetical protein